MTGTFVLVCGGYRSGSTGVMAQADAAAHGGDSGKADGIDSRTLLHPQHVAHPDGGGWRTWTPTERALVEAHVGPLLERFGYR